MLNTLTMIDSFHFHRFLLLALAAAMASGTIHARSFRVSMVPNGSVYSCSTCHFNPGGGGPRNPFGQAVQAITGSSNIPFWTASLAALDSDGDGFTNGEELGDPEGDFTLIPGAQVTRPGDAASFPAVSPPVLDGGSLEIVGPTVVANWAGGKEPFIVQLKSELGDVEWMNVMTTTNTRAALLQSANAGYFRVGSEAATTVIPLTAWLVGDNEVAAVDSPGFGQGTLSLEGDTLAYLISYSGLKADAQAAHIHGPATSTENATVLHALAGAVGTSGVLKGAVTLSAPEKDLLLSGRTYVNIHTAAHEDGEIRGQIAPTRWQAQLAGEAEVPPVTTAASGNATSELVGNQLFWRISFSNLTGPAQAAHLHGPASPTENALPLVAFAVPAAASGSAEGVVTLEASTILMLIDGKTYVNVHTTQNGSGEIRGQVTPAP